MKLREPDLESVPAAAGFPAPPAGSAPAPPTLITIRPTRGLAALGLRDVWQYRELLLFLVWRDIKVKYKQTLVGLLWVIVQPVTTMVVFTFIFGRLAKLPSQGVPYPLFVLSGLVAWQYFATTLTTSTTSVVASGGLISKVYFPRLLVPLGSALSALVDLAVAMGILGVLMGWYGEAPAWRMLALPVLVLLAMLTALSIGLWLSMLNVQFRDVQYTVPFLIQIWLFASPVAYAGTLIPPRFRVLFSLNPMTTVVNGFRWCLLGTPPHFQWGNVVSLVVVVLLLIGGVVYFKHAEKTFVDVI